MQEMKECQPGVDKETRLVRKKRPWVGAELERSRSEKKRNSTSDKERGREQMQQKTRTGGVEVD